MSRALDRSSAVALPAPGAAGGRVAGGTRPPLGGGSPGARPPDLCSIWEVAEGRCGGGGPGIECIGLALVAAIMMFPSLYVC